MKRILSILLILIFSLSLASCGKSEEYTYDFLPFDYPTNVISIRHRNQLIKGGAYLYMNLNDIEGYEKAVTNVPMISLFNEDTKTLMPLCFDVTCEHGIDNLNCFGNLYGYALFGPTGIYQDKVFCVLETPHVRGQKVNNQLEAVYYGLDGIVHENIKFTPELIMPNGDALEDKFVMQNRYLIYGTKLYFGVWAYVTGADSAVFLDQSEIAYAHWFISYDIETTAWKLINSTPYIFNEQNILITDAMDNKISFHCSGVGYVIDTETGETEVYDCAEIVDEMIAEGKLPVGTIITRIYPLRDYFECNMGSENFELKISTQERADSSQIQDTYTNYIFNGEPYCFEYNSDMNYIAKNRTTGEMLQIVIEGIRIEPFCESEKGIIFSYRVVLEDGSLEPETYVAKEAGKDVEYWYPQKYVYVTKEDILDGNIDEPWYYDAETYSFVQE